MPSKRGFAANRGSCEAQFHSGHAEDISSSHPSKASPSGHSFLGIFKQISKETGEMNNTISSHNEQAHNYINNPSTTTNSQNKNSDATVSEQFISSSSRHISSSSSRIYNNKNQQHAVNLAVDNSIINDDISENNKDDISSATSTEKSADSSSKQLITPSAAFAYPHHAVVRLQNAWAFAATASELSQQQQLSVADNEINTNNSKPKIRHFAKKRPRPSRREKNRLKKKRRNRRGAHQVARKFKAMNSA